MSGEIVLHSDLNCFYASVEINENPQLRGKAVAVCGSTEDRHGIVLTASYAHPMRSRKSVECLAYRGVHCFLLKNKAEAQNRSRLQAASCIPAKRTQIGGNLQHICRHSKRLTTIGESFYTN